MEQNQENKKDACEALTVQQLADTLQIGRNAAYKLVHSDQLRCITIGRSIRVPRSALTDYLNSAG